MPVNDVKEPFLEEVGPDPHLSCLTRDATRTLFLQRNLRRKAKSSPTRVQDRQWQPCQHDGSA
jgi:hypothetical protein